MMGRTFEDEFMDIQAGLISLCLELTGEDVDKVYAYASIEQKSMMFNAFFEKGGRVLTINQVGVDNATAMNFLRIGTMDLQKLKNVCEENGKDVPTEIKMYYEVQTHRFNSDCKYDEICSAKTGVSSGEVFASWCNEVKNSLAPEEPKSKKKWFGLFG